MLKQDTIELLRECDAGIKMGVESIKEVLDYVNDQEFRKSLIQCKDKHEELRHETEALLDRYHGREKDPNLMAKGMSWIKTNMKLAMDGSDQTIAELMTDGCDMGAKSLSRFLNQYEAADEKSKNIARKLIRLEESLTKDIRKFL